MIFILGMLVVAAAALGRRTKHYDVDGFELIRTMRKEKDK